MTASEKRLLLPPLRAAAQGQGMTTFEARKLLERFDRKPSIKARAIKKERKQKKLRERQSHGKETAAIRAAVFGRARGHCELGCGGHPDDMHHLEGGIGRRKQRQSVENCVAACRLCHRLYHDNPEAFRGPVGRWCLTYGYPMPSRFSRPARPSNARTLKGALP